MKHINFNLTNRECYLQIWFFSFSNKLFFYLNIPISNGKTTSMGLILEFDNWMSRWKQRISTGVFYCQGFWTTLYCIQLWRLYNFVVTTIIYSKTLNKIRSILVSTFDVSGQSGILFHKFILPFCVIQLFYSFIYFLHFIFGWFNKCC